MVHGAPGEEGEHRDSTRLRPVMPVTPTINATLEEATATAVGGWCSFSSTMFVWGVVVRCEDILVHGGHIVLIL